MKLNVCPNLNWASSVFCPLCNCFFCFDLICICILICTIYCATMFARWIKIFNVVWLYAYLFSSRTQLIKFPASRQRLRSQYRPSPVLLLLLLLVLRLSVAGLEMSRPGTNKHWHSADRRPNEVRLCRALVARGSLKPLHDVVALSRRRPVSPVGDVYRRQTCTVARKCQSSSNSCHWKELRCRHYPHHNFLKSCGLDNVDTTTLFNEMNWKKTGTYGPP